MIICKLYSSFDTPVLQESFIDDSSAGSFLEVRLLVRGESFLYSPNHYFLKKSSFLVVTYYHLPLQPDNFAFLPRSGKFSIVEVFRYFFIIDSTVYFESVFK